MYRDGQAVFLCRGDIGRDMKSRVGWMGRRVTGKGGLQVRQKTGWRDAWKAGKPRFQTLSEGTQSRRTGQVECRGKAGTSPISNPPALHPSGPQGLGLLAPQANQTQLFLEQDLEF